MYNNSYIPFRGYFSSPFSKWQGSLQSEHPLELVTDTAKKWLETKKITPAVFDYLFIGMTVIQKHSFYAAMWAAARLGNPGIGGLLIEQACSTSTTALNQAALGIENGIYNNVICLMADRLSNGPHIVWPNIKGPGGQVTSENWVMDNFNYDPYGKVPMVQTAENVVKKVGGISKEECDEVTYRRYEQYLDSMADGRKFQKKYMLPLEFKKSKKEVMVLEADEGIMPTTKEALAKLKPVIPGGVHSFGSQTHPADGNAAFIVTTREKAKELSADPNIEIQICSYGFARAEKAHMAMAPVPATVVALERAGIGIDQVKVIKSHNPFIANDLYFAREFGVDVMGFNNYGSSLIFGHPQGPTVARLICEAIEELVLLGGGYGLITGCAAGDTGATLIIQVKG
jgi:acetyl-CoA acetyltransferase family protein